jgi:hypothetical protein
LFLGDSVDVEGAEETNAKLQVKMQLAKMLLKLPFVYEKKSVKSKIRWDEIQIDGHTPEQLKTMFEEIMTLTGYSRTLKEVLTFYKQNHLLCDRKMNPNCPKKPMSVKHLYYNDNVQDLKAEFIEKFGITQDSGKVKF